MRFTSLVIELIRARPKLVVWLVVVLQALLWLLVSLLLYRSPPGDLATVIALGREYRVGTDLGPPLAFWLADIAFRAAGNHMFGVYLLAQICSISTFWTLYLLARATVGVQQAVLAVLLTMTVLAFSAPGLEFGPLVLARPIWALLLLHSWQLIGQNRRNAWFAWSIEAGLLLLTTPAAAILLAFVVAFALTTARGRRILVSLDALFALLVIVVLALPYLIWLIRADVPVLPHWPAVVDLGGRAVHGLALFGGLLLASMGIAIVSVFNSGWFDRRQEEAPVIFRPPVDPAARDFVYFFAFAPAIVGCLVSGLFDLDHVVGGPGIVLLMSGLAAIVACGDLIYLRRQQILRTIWAAMILAPAVGVFAATLFVPWTGGGEVTTSLPTAAIGHFFDDSFERRTNRRLAAVSGDAQLATLVTLSPTRPHLFLAAAPERTPWLNLEKFNQTGGVVVWRASDTDGTPPPDIAKLFPGLAPEVPQTFDRLVDGRQPLLRIGWGIVRPKAQ
ncbi:MAG TPA: glycosyltransferase family 39 protein [Bradyrhizobium sp.]|uniref:glycosyltransferase family 39 protein n=1 Tax=Bradyrhizobium sp. TaxID=376 RepID=UPI002D7F66C9|nr:glycosyltransferase family 39 protein [Bradyrhizobium sp.]HET7888196.1 glycosyltransferase family 39 protein [Bradyrhizobium sp.]